MNSSLLSKIRASQGFTIVELLVVIVIIGILASITIVSYNGITSRANTASAQSAAQSVAMKIELFNAETGRYPYLTSDFTSDSSQTYYVSPTSVLFTLTTTQPATPSTLKVIKCGTTPNTTQANIISSNSNLTGLRIHYWTYSGTASADNYYVAGSDTGAGIACPTS